MTEGRSGRSAYRVGVAAVIVTSMLSAWTTIVHDDGNGLGSFLVIMAAGVGAFSAWFRPAGMARTMIGVAAMQIMTGAALATAPLTATVPGGSFRALASNGIFAILWFISAALFRIAAKDPR